MRSRFLIATALMAAVIAAIIATAARSNPVDDGADEDADADRAVDYCGIVVVGPDFHDTDNSREGQHDHA